jgi:pilus assembly protein Flp/PilA
MTNFVRKFVNDESGASAAEYALILVVIGLAIVVAATTLSGAIGGAMTKAASCINLGTASAAC